VLVFLDRALTNRCECTSKKGARNQASHKFKLSNVQKQQKKSEDDGLKPCCLAYFGFKKVATSSFTVVIPFRYKGKTQQVQIMYRAWM